MGSTDLWKEFSARQEEVAGRFSGDQENTFHGS
jgi:hypothetical protein